MVFEHKCVLAVCEVKVFLIFCIYSVVLLFNVQDPHENEMFHLMGLILK